MIGKTARHLVPPDAKWWYVFGSATLCAFMIQVISGISEPPQPGKPVDPKTYRQECKELIAKRGRPFWPDAAWRNVVFCVAMIVVIAALGLIFGAPQLEKPPDRSIIAASPRPD
jgi:ubiquinol-cytochrome c reductase cytochrome b subunit